MKKFNQMTEVQMSKTNGGFPVMTALLLTLTGVVTGTGLGMAANK